MDISENWHEMQSTKIYQVQRSKTTHWDTSFYVYMKMSTHIPCIIKFSTTRNCQMNDFIVHQIEINFMWYEWNYDETIIQYISLTWLMLKSNTEIVFDNFYDSWIVVNSCYLQFLCWLNEYSFHGNQICFNIYTIQNNEIWKLFQSLSWIRVDNIWIYFCLDDS